jgi:hypothetical protein
VYGTGSDPVSGGGSLAAVGLAGTAATAGSLAFTGIQAIGLALFAATLILSGLVLVRLAAVRRSRIAVAPDGSKVAATARRHPRRGPGQD